ncbi:MAG: hypothetical protein IT161_02855 [Bryobacterales bacterium]|nr:hypothetical protein [Bryobacterales bacterium]
MLRASLTLVMSCSLFLCAAQEKRKSKVEVAVVEMKVQRLESRVAIEGKVRNDGEQTIKGLLLVIYFDGPDGEPITTLKGPIESPVLEPDEESDFRLEAAAPARAVVIRLDGQDKSGRDIKITNIGPYAIE